MLPGTRARPGAVLVWAVAGPATATPGRCFAVAAAVLAVGTVVKYVVPGPPAEGRRRPHLAPCGRRARAGVVGFFVIPVVGLLVGFPIGIYVAERAASGAPAGLAVDQGGAARGRPQHPDRAGRRRSSRPPCGSPAWSPRDAVLLALLGAVSYGVSDFIGGLASKRATVWSVAAAGLRWRRPGRAASLALVVGGDPTGADLAWGALAGLGNGFGTAFLYRGLSGGPDGRRGPGARASVRP